MASHTSKSATAPKRTRTDGRGGSTFIEEARRRQILDAAMTLFGRRGFDQTSLAEIAGNVGISKGVISYHFDGKRELGEEVIRHAVRQFGQYVNDRVATKKTGRGKLLEFVSASFDYIDEHPGDYMTYADTLRCFGTREERREMIAWVNARTREVLRSIIQEGRSDGSIGGVSPGHLADIVQGVIDGLMEQVSVEPAVVDLDGCKRLVRKMLRRIMDAEV